MPYATPEKTNSEAVECQISCSPEDEQQLTKDKLETAQELQLFSRAIEMSVDGIVIGDLSGVISYVNAAFLKMFGSTEKSDVIGKHVLEFVVERERERAFQNSMECLKTGQSFASEYVVLTKSGSEIQVEVTIAVIKDKEGRDIGFIDVIREIGERKKVEEALRRQANLIDLSPNAIIVKKADDTITFWSQGAQNLYGWTKGEAVGQKSRELFKAKFPEPYEEVLRQLKQTGRWSGEKINRTKIGREIIVSSRWLAHFDSQGGIEEILESNVDITELKSLQKKLEQHSKELEVTVAERTKELSEAQARLLKSERLAAIGELAGMIGHDLRNPLTAIKNAAYYLKKKQDNSVSDSCGDMLNIIDSSVEQANKIVNDLLDFSREMPLELEECTPKSLVAYSLLPMKIPVNVKITDRTESSPNIWVDISKIQRVFVNLIQNAIEAMHNGGTLEISSRQNKGNVDFYFQDTGDGMSGEVVDKIFTPLFTTKAKGMGFGLAICKRIVDAHGGKITVESDLRKGTKFIVSLPVLNP